MPESKAGISFGSGTPGANSGCRKCSTPKNTIGAAKNHRPNSTSHRTGRALPNAPITLHLRVTGKAALDLIDELAKQHQNALCAALNEDERILLADLLFRVAQDQGLEAGVHPGFARLKGEGYGPTLKGLGSDMPPCDRE